MTKVSIVTCEGYQYQEVKQAVRKSLELIGGLNKIIKPGMKVLLKPNILSAKVPEAAVTTHPTLVKAMVELVKEAGGIPWVGDSSGGVIAGQAPTKQALLVTGIQAAAEEAGAQVINFDTIGTLEQPNPRDKSLGSYHIAKAVLEADLVISLPKLKTHSATLFTGAVKNLFGVIPGFRKAEYHRISPKPSEFIETLLDIYTLAKPALAVMDGIVAMEGNGPAAGKPRSLGLILAGWDCVAVDAIASNIIGFAPGRVGTLVRAGQRGLGTTNLAEIEISGESLEKVKVRNFELPPNAILERLPGFLTKSFLGVIKARPVAAPELCTGCSFCVNNCPVKVIRLNEDSKPVIDYDKCIECLCCQELCPQQAIKLKQYHWLGKIVAGVIEKNKEKRREQ